MGFPTVPADDFLAKGYKEELLSGAYSPSKSTCPSHKIEAPETKILVIIQLRAEHSLECKQVSKSITAVQLRAYSDPPPDPTPSISDDLLV